MYSIKRRPNKLIFKAQPSPNAYSKPSSKRSAQRAGSRPTLAIRQPDISLLTILTTGYITTGKGKGASAKIILEPQISCSSELLGGDCFGDGIPIYYSFGGLWTGGSVVVVVGLPSWVPV
ncbi:hypothetical protein BO85DRAFT_35192 [Aspergillus piperis CBS 112811]|uniref:Uncharacterized protein n=1 Tax=Aspergillus piperis CBS 112811 TaxID=1448313 RepID=A0A8G1VNY1_9EURO|nr:hypothetical protein BO85DRAFT_35192 [Aspergillus piperis CBS 112811]RAH57188.1 hypothetical protein BO85DRAFT_35192 [Aspergillus piperis CBS 112811]